MATTVEQSSQRAAERKCWRCNGSNPLHHQIMTRDCMQAPGPGPRIGKGGAPNSMNRKVCLPGKTAQKSTS
jgi:hypothetical protein